MKEEKWSLKANDKEKGYLKETQEFILKLKNDLMQKILNSSKKDNVAELHLAKDNHKDSH